MACSSRFFLDISSGKCRPVNPLCKTADLSGNCQSCYPGYVLQGTMCVLGEAANMDVNCA